MGYMTKGVWNGYGKDEHGNILKTEFVRDGLYEDGEHKCEPEYVVEEYDPEKDFRAKKIEFEKYLVIVGIPDDKKVEEITKRVDELDLDKTEEMKKRA